MKKRVFYIIIIIWMLMDSTAFSKGGPSNIPRMDFDELEPLLHQNNDTVYIINFWATWCKPCVKELPEFEKFSDDFKNRKVKVVLVSLDFPNQHDNLLLPFVRDHNLKSSVIHLTDVDANKWIDKVDPGWSGAIPATLIYKGPFRKFYEGSLNYEQIKSIVEPKI